ncbi:MAG: S24/S26 family peptidase [Eubacteriales bacterium]|nr:S24/S26 family peptidase [Eubacteriales bacterium]
MIKKEIVVDMRELIDDIKDRVNNGNLVTLAGQGESMKPYITADDVLTFRKPENKNAKVGEIYLYKRADNSYAIHRVYKRENDFVFMLGDAQLFIEKVVKSDLVAIVTTIQRPQKTVVCTGVFERYKCVLRMKSRVLKATLRQKHSKVKIKVKLLLSKIKQFILKER